MKIDAQIQEIDGIICRHINSAAFFSRGEISQDILAQLRNFVEHVMLKFYAGSEDIEDSYGNIQAAIRSSKARADLKPLWQLHDLLKVSASHYSVGSDASERLMLKYYEYRLIIRDLLHDEYSMDVLSNLESFPLQMDPALQEYYEAIAAKVNDIRCQGQPPHANRVRCYIRKIKPFFVKGHVYYEVTFTPAHDWISKTEHFIAFTYLDISSFYAVDLLVLSDGITVVGREMPIALISGWRVSIRDCEFKNFSRLFHGDSAPRIDSREKRAIDHFLTESGHSLLYLLDCADEEYDAFGKRLSRLSGETHFLDDLTRARSISRDRLNGCNILRYLLLHMRNRILKQQYQRSQNNLLSGLYLQNGCIPFDTMPFAVSPLGHNPTIYDLLHCGFEGKRKHEFLARAVRDNAEVNRCLFTKCSDLERYGGLDDLRELVAIHERTLWCGHRDSSKLVLERGHVFINGYKNDVCSIIRQLLQLSSSGIAGYSSFARSWLNSSGSPVLCQEKRDIIPKLFESSCVAVVQGSAGTGKTTLVGYIAQLYASSSKLFLAQTNPAVDNLKRRVSAPGCEFRTIASFLNSASSAVFDLLFIDECSTVSNRDMCSILAKSRFKLLVLVGDPYQIASIRFGNWFSISAHFLPENSLFILNTPYRSESDQLKSLWNEIRTMRAGDPNEAAELLARYGFSRTLDESLFDSFDKGEVVLCLNYDGLYGINNVNRFLQQANGNPAIEWGIQVFKVGDPVLFNESRRFAPVIYNNMKGTIVGVEVLDKGLQDERIQFDIELDAGINPIAAQNCGLELLGDSASGNPVVRFRVFKEGNVDVDEISSPSATVIPFQVAYAISIHKAQGLEYDSVKVVITDEVDEMITHNIFYTAITRARKQLCIYWSPEAQLAVLSRIEPRNVRDDVALVKGYLGM